MDKKERPGLENLINSATTEMETFQNSTIRPIIKMQHLLLVASFINYLQKRKIDFSTLSEQKRRSRIKAIFIKDINFKNFTIGLVIGHFSAEEFNFYTLHSSEINRRVTQITTQRIQDSIPEL